MPNCDEIRSRLDDWLDDTLSSDDRGEIERHLDVCANCRTWFAKHESLATDLSVLAGAANRMGAGKSAAPAERSQSTRIWRVAAMIAVTAGALFVSRGFFQSGRNTVVVENPEKTTQPNVESRITLGLSEKKPFNIDLDDAHFAVNMESSDPEIHIVWVYQDQMKIEPNADDVGDNSELQPPPVK